MVKLDGHKLMYHADRVTAWQVGLNPPPISVEISPSSRCNHKCTFCAYKPIRGYEKNTSASLLDKMAQEFPQFGVRSVVIAGDGEPLLNKNICSFITDIVPRGTECALSTNGVLMEPNIFTRIGPFLTWIRFSVNGTGDVYRKIHSAKKYDFQRMISNISSAVKEKRKNKYNVTLGAQYIMTKYNYKDVVKTTKLLTSLGLDYVAVKPFYPFPGLEAQSVPHDAHGLTDILKEAVEYGATVRWEAIDYASSEKKYDKCYGHYFMCRVSSSGNVFLCPPHRKDVYQIGSLEDNTMQQIWSSKLREKVVAKITNVSKMCYKGCRYEAMNTYLNAISTDEDSHHNFI